MLDRCVCTPPSGRKDYGQVQTAGGTPIILTLLPRRRTSSGSLAKFAMRASFVLVAPRLAIFLELAHQRPKLAALARKAYEFIGAHRRSHQRPACMQHGS